MNLPEIILSRFKGRPDTVAVADSGGFHPEPTPPTAEMLARHVTGDQCYGFYLMDTQNRVNVTCVDFDDHPEKPDPEWRNKAELLYAALVHFGLSPLVEISQSGSGCHVWLFMEEPTPAWVPRAWWRSVAAKLSLGTLEVYPRQDELTGKGLGNLVRYPLWNKSRFVDPDDDFAELQAPPAIMDVRPTSGTDLSLLAFQLGLGELKADPKTTVAMIAEVGEMLPLRVQKLLSRKGTLLSRRWSGEMETLQDKSRSALAQSIACELVRLYVPTAEIASALRFWCRANNYHEKGDRDDWINRTVAKAYDFTVERTETKSLDVMTFQQACHTYLDQIEQGKGRHFGSGIKELDDSIDGAGEGEVVILAARPGHGKSAVAFQWVDAVARGGTPCLLISEEMGASEIGKRRLCSIATVPQEQWVAASVAHLRREVDNHHAVAAPVYIVEGVNTIDRAEEIIDQFCSLHGVGLVAVDYLQLLGSRSKDRYEVVTEISRRIKQATRRNNCRTLLLSQLNRGVENRDDHEPKLSDLRESGQIEQDADLVLFLQWPCRFDSDVPKQEYRIYAAKRRNGPIRTQLIESSFCDDRQVVGIENCQGLYYADPDDDGPPDF